MLLLWSPSQPVQRVLPVPSSETPSREETHTLQKLVPTIDLAAWAAVVVRRGAGAGVSGPLRWSRGRPEFGAAPALARSARPGSEMGASNHNTEKRNIFDSFLNLELWKLFFMWKVEVFWPLFYLLSSVSASLVLIWLNIKLSSVLRLLCICFAAGYRPDSWLRPTWLKLILSCRSRHAGCNPEPGTELALAARLSLQTKAVLFERRWSRRGADRAAGACLWKG